MFWLVVDPKGSSFINSSWFQLPVPPVSLEHCPEEVIVVSHSKPCAIQTSSEGTPVGFPNSSTHLAVFVATSILLPSESLQTPS